MRLSAYRIILACLLLFLIAGLFFTQVICGRRYYELSLRNSVRLIPQESYRGRIFDTHGLLLVDNAMSFDAVVVPQDMKQEQEVFRGLADILGMARQDVVRRYKRGYVNPFTPVVIMAGITKEAAIALEERAFDWQGVGVVINARRYYPYGATAAHALGYMGEIDKSRITRLKEYGYDLRDKVGYSGLEEELDLFLRGEKGGEQIEVDSRGRQVRVLGYKPPTIGRDVQVTLDLAWQQTADQLMQGRRGAVVVMDVTSGAVLAMASAPGFDPNVFIDRKDKKALNHYLGSNDAPLFNRATCGQFPPGSVFKVVTASAALTNKKFKTSMTFVCPGYLHVGNRPFKCWAEHGPQDFFQAMGHSCDVYFYHLGFWAGSDQMTAMAKEFGLGSLTGIDQPQERAGFIPSRLWKRLTKFEPWYDGDTANFSIGQGFVLVTPLQLARMMAAVANGGVLVEPHLTKAIGGKFVDVKPGRKIRISSEDLAMVRQSLRYPVALETGTAHTLDIPGLEMCAKTGTAQVTGKLAHGWVAGFFPLSQPRYAFCILLENTDSSHDAVELARALILEVQAKGRL